jgi:NitT/TauT family transport system ATP-binding protein
MEIRINDVSKSFGGKKVLDRFTAVLPDGQITVLTGQSGSGKTTLAYLLLGLNRPDFGSIDGLTGKRLAAVFQEDRLCEQLSGIGNVRLVIKKNTETADLLTQFAEVELTADDAKKAAGQLSGGQKRRIAILRAMLAESDFICMDEPFKGMDKETKEKTMAYVKKAVAGKTVLLITHDRSEADYFGGQRIELAQV